MSHGTGRVCVDPPALAAYRSRLDAAADEVEAAARALGRARSAWNAAMASTTLSVCAARTVGDASVVSVAERARDLGAAVDRVGRDTARADVVPPRGGTATSRWVPTPVQRIGARAVDAGAWVLDTTDRWDDELELLGVGLAVVGGVALLVATGGLATPVVAGAASTLAGAATVGGVAVAGLQAADHIAEGDLGHGAVDLAVMWLPLGLGRAARLGRVLPRPITVGGGLRSGVAAIGADGIAPLPSGVSAPVAAALRRQAVRSGLRVGVVPPAGTWAADGVVTALSQPARPSGPSRPSSPPRAGGARPVARPARGVISAP